MVRLVLGVDKKKIDKKIIDAWWCVQFIKNKGVQLIYNRNRIKLQIYSTYSVNIVHNIC
jgi:hypothetical protein